MFLEPLAQSERFRQSVEGPIGWFTVVADARAVIHTEWGRAPANPSPDGRLRITTGPSPEPEAGERLVAEAPLPAPSTDSIYVFLTP